MIMRTLVHTFCTSAMKTFAFILVIALTLWGPYGVAVTLDPLEVANMIIDKYHYEYNYNYDYENNYSCTV